MEDLRYRTFTFCHCFLSRDTRKFTAICDREDGSGGGGREGAPPAVTRESARHTRERIDRASARSLRAWMFMKSSRSFMAQLPTATPRQSTFLSWNLMVHFISSAWCSEEGRTGEPRAAKTKRRGERNGCACS